MREKDVWTLNTKHKVRPFFIQCQHNYRKLN